MSRVPRPRKRMRTNNGGAYAPTLSTGVQRPSRSAAASSGAIAAALTAKMESLRRKMDDSLSKKDASLRELNAKLEAVLKEEQNTADEYKAYKTKTERELEDAWAQLKDSQTLCSELRQTLETTQDSLQNEKEKNNEASIAFEKESGELRIECTRKNGEIEEMTEETQRLRTELSASASQLSATQSELSGALAAKATADAISAQSHSCECRDRSEELAMAKKLAGTLRREVERQRSEMKHMAEVQFAGMRDAYERKVRGIASENDSLRQQCTESELRCEELELRLDSGQSESSEQLSALKSDCKVLASKLQRWQQTAQQLFAECTSPFDLQRLLQSHFEVALSAVRERDEARAALSQATESLAELRQRMDACAAKERRVDSLQTDLQCANDKCESFLRIIAGDSMDSAFVAAQRSGDDALLKRIASLESESSALSAQNEELQQCLRKEAAASNALAADRTLLGVGTANESLQKCKEKMEESQGEILRLKQALSEAKQSGEVVVNFEWRQRVTQLEAACDARRKEAEKLTTALERQRRTNERLQEIFSAKSKSFRKSLCTLTGWDLALEPPTHGVANGEEVYCLKHAYMDAGSDERLLLAVSRSKRLGQKDTVEVRVLDTAFARIVDRKIFGDFRRYGSSPVLLSQISLFLYRRRNPTATVEVGGEDSAAVGRSEEAASDAIQ